MNEHELQQHLQQPVPAPDAASKARHMAAALEVFQVEQQCEKVDGTTAGEEKKSNVLQGFLQRLRLTRDTNHHGSDSMRSSNPDQHSIFQKPVLISAIAASSLAVVAGLTMTKYVGINSNEHLDNILAYESTDKLNVAPAVDEANEQVEAEEAVVAQAVVKEQAVALARHAASAKVAPDTRRVMAMREPIGFAPAPIVADHSMRPAPEFRDRFTEVKENSVTNVAENPVSTFSIDVDTASYSFVRRMLNAGKLPAKDAVRSEEMINYFDYNYPLPTDKKTPFSNSVTVVDSPWTQGNKLIHIGIQGYQLTAGEVPQSNLVFLLDVSGSMDEPSKLPLVKQSMGLLLDTLKPDDTIAIAVYAGAAGTVLEPTKVKEKQKILAALNNLQAGGSTAGADGIELAYQLAEANFNKKGVNRIILATDGDFNVGQTSDKALQELVERKRDKGIYLSVLGFGQGNYQDAMMQTLAQNGNGVAAYIDTLSEAQKVLVTEATSNLFPIAKDVKIQVEFNPATVKEYRLIGYETRALNREDFNNDKVDAGEIGAGQRVTAIYEITPVESNSGLLNESRYQTPDKQNMGKQNTSDKNSEYAFLRLRYKLPNETKSNLVETPIAKKALREKNPAYMQEVNFSIAVAGFAQLLRGSNYVGDFNYDKVIELAQANKGQDEFGYRTEFIQLVRKAKIAH